MSITPPVRPVLKASVMSLIATPPVVSVNPYLNIIFRDPFRILESISSMTISLEEVVKIIIYPITRGDLMQTSMNR